MAKCDSGELFTTEIEEMELKVKTFFKMDVVALMAKMEVPVLGNFPKHTSLRICAIAWNYHMANLTWSFWPTSKHLLTWKSLKKNESEVSRVLLLFTPDQFAKKCFFGCME